MKFPFDWQPRIVSTSVARIGGFTIAAVPGEFSTMAGRRLRQAVTGGLKVTQSGSTTWGLSSSWKSSSDGSVTWSNTSRPIEVNNNIERDNENSLLMEDSASDGPVVIAGLCNTYSSYIVTPEEYSVSFNHFYYKFVTLPLLFLNSKVEYFRVALKSRSRAHLIDFLNYVALCLFQGHFESHFYYVIQLKDVAVPTMIHNFDQTIAQILFYFIMSFRGS